MAKVKSKTAKNKGGRPKHEFTEAQVLYMGELALQGCQNNTIATIMDIPIDTLTRGFAKLLTKRRAERKQTLREQQNTSAKGGNVTMQIWLGKNVLDQTDKHEQVIDVKGNLAEFLKAMKNE